MAVLSIDITRINYVQRTDHNCLAKYFMAWFVVRELLQSFPLHRPQQAHPVQCLLDTGTGLYLQESFYCYPFCMSLLYGMQSEWLNEIGQINDLIPLEGPQCAQDFNLGHLNECNKVQG